MLSAGEALQELRAWEPVGSLLETARGAIAGTDGLTARDLERLRTWPGIWQSLAPPMREFYALWAPVNTTASIALMRQLDGHPIQSWQIGRLHALWREQFGTDCPYNLQTET
jgi:hypothetical protein